MPAKGAPVRVQELFPAVDEDVILSIEIENYENKKENLNINFVNLLTRTEENIRKSKEFRIRGNTDLP